MTDTSTGQISSRVAMIVMIGCSSVVMLDNTMINVALPTIGRQMHLDTADLQWIIDGYTLVFAGVMLTAGAACDRYGKARILVIGLVAFVAVSTAVTQASSADEIILGRAALGLSAALVYPPTLGLVVAIAVSRVKGNTAVDVARSRALAVWASAGGIGVACGPLVGGWLLEHYDWHSIFVLNIPLGLIALAAIWFTRYELSEVSEATEDMNDPRHRISILGACLSMAAVGLVVYSIIEAPVSGWTSRDSLIRYIAGAVSAGLLILHQRRTSAPLVPWNMFRDRRMSLGSFAVLMAFGSLFGLVFVLTLYFQLVRQASALTAGAMLLPFAVAMAVGALLATAVHERFGWALPISAGFGVVALGVWSFTRIEPGASYWAYPFIGLSISGLGFALIQVPATACIMTSLRPNAFGIGSAVNDTAREVGGAVGVAVLGSIFSTVFTRRLGSPEQFEHSDSLAELVVGASAPNGPESTSEIRGTLIRDGFLPALHASSLVAASMMVVTGLLIAGLSLCLAARRADLCPLIGNRL